MVIEQILTSILEKYLAFQNAIPQNYQVFPPIILITFTILLYSTFIWFFYRFLAKRDILKLDLKRYNSFGDPTLAKIVGTILYTIEFVLIIPAVIFLWFSIFAMMFIILAKEIDVGIVILVSTGLISAIRIASYFSEDLAKELAKLFPFVFLSYVVLTPGFFDINTTILRLSKLPLFFEIAAYSFIFIIFVELILRTIYIPLTFIKSLGKNNE